MGRMDAHRAQQVPARPHAHEPRGHPVWRAAHGALPPAQAFDAAELNPSSMSCATGAESMATIRTTARNLCVAVTDAHKLRAVVRIVAIDSAPVAHDIDEGFSSAGSSRCA